MILVQVLASVAVNAVWAAVSGDAEMTAEKMITASSSASVLTIILFVWRRWMPLSRAYMQSKPWVDIYWCVILALGMLIPSQFIEELIPEQMKTDIIADQMKMILSNNWGYIAVGLLAPIVEELVFRGAIQREAMAFFAERFANAKNKNIAHWVAIAFTALLFAAVHGNPAQIPHAFLIGLLLGWLCYRSGSIVPGIVVHWVNNTFAFLLYAFYPRSYDMNLADFFGGSSLRVCAAIALSLLLFLPALRQLNRMENGEWRTGNRE